MIKVNPSSGKVRFEVTVDASEVSLMGDFNGWNDAKHVMKKSKNGSWVIEIKLAPGEYQFLYFVDRRVWKTDEAAPRVVNSFGTENSLLKIPSKAAKKTTAKKPSRARK
jgi:1,4-alpha-glucan branching enzyme